MIKVSLEQICFIIKAGLLFRWSHNTLCLPNVIMQFWNISFNIKNKREHSQQEVPPNSLHQLTLCSSLSSQRRNAWPRVFRTCSSRTICHRWRLSRCSPASPVSLKTPATCHRLCWTISECARVTPSSATSCSGTASLLQLTAVILECVVWSFIHTSLIVSRLEQAKEDESKDALKDLVNLVTCLTTYGVTELKPAGLTTGAPFLLPGFVLPQSSGKGELMAAARVYS